MLISGRNKKLKIKKKMKEEEGMQTDYSDPFNLDKLANLETRFSFPIGRKNKWREGRGYIKLFIASISFFKTVKAFSLN